MHPVHVAMCILSCVWHVFRGMGAQGATGGAGKREVGRFKARVRVVEADLKRRLPPPSPAFSRLPSPSHAFCQVRVVEADLKSRALPRLDLADLFEQVPVHRMLEHAWHARA